MIYHKNRLKKQLFVFGHRGAPKLYLENSLKSINAAIESGADGVELDIQCTADNFVILFHDNFIISKSNKKHFINQTPLFQINKMCKEKKVPTPDLFTDFISIIYKNPHVIFNIEVKSSRINNFYILQKIVDLISPEALQNQCIISSFNRILLYQLKFQLGYNHSIAPIVSHNFLLSWYGRIFGKLYINTLKPDFFHMNIHHIDCSLIEWVHSKNIAINVYTVNNHDMFNKCIELKIDGIFTDNHSLY